MKVVCPDANIRLMFRITKVDQVLQLHEHEQLAINAFHERPPLKIHSGKSRVGAKLRS